VLTVTFIASEALAVITVMPLVARDLGGLSLYGWVFSAFMLGSLVGIVLAGRDADRRGPVRPYLAGLVLFSSGLLVAGLAPSMSVLVVGRALQGVGAGAVPAVAYVAIGRSLPEPLRPRMMAVLSTAWVVPGVIGPALAAEVAHVFGWRWVFLGLLPLVGLAGPLALPALIRLGRPEVEPAVEHRARDAMRTAVGAALLLSALVQHRVALGGPLALLGLLVGLPALRRLLPTGSLRARPGLPATILSRGLLTFGFFGADAYVTLSITTVRHHSTVMAGAVVTASTLAWTAGSWIQARLSDQWEGKRLVRLGLVCILCGIAGIAIFLQRGVPIAEGFAAWTVAGFGMGLSYAPTALMMLRAAPAGREGWASASLNLADVLGTALGVGIGGAAVATAAREALPVSTGVTIAFAVGALGTIAGLVISHRLPRTLAPPHRVRQSSATPRVHDRHEFGLRQTVTTHRARRTIVAEVKPIPDNYPRVSPYLHIDGAAQAIEFYKEVFGATERLRMSGPDGRIGHAELAIGNSVVMLADEHPEIGVKGPKAFGGSAVVLQIYVEDVDAAIERAVKLGATLERPVEDKFYGDRIGQIEDPFGHVWSVQTHIEDVSPDELQRRAALLAGGA
jgi:uncharacterized glyoxalase superfamily protein PhnB/MFS family permease